jgi:drug/metabolite transporter (DMT)-like permease
MAVGACLISFSAVFVRVAQVGPTVAGVYRVLFGALILLPVVIIRREKLFSAWPPVLLAAGCGLLFTLDLSCWHRSIHYIGPGLSTVLGNFQVFFLAAAGIFIFKDKISWTFLLAVPLAMLGLFLLVGLEWDELGRDHKLGVGYALLTALIYALFVLLLRKARSMTPALSTSGILLVLSVVSFGGLGLVALASGESFYIPNVRSWAALLGYGVISQVIGWLLISDAMPRVRTSRIGLILLLQPTLTFIWDMVLFGRPTAPIELGGAAIALGGIYLGSLKR